MTTSTIEQELLGATNLKPRARESRKKYVIRILEAVGELPDAEWDSLSEATQRWCNEMMDAHNAADENGAEFEVPEWPDLNGAGESEPVTDAATGEDESKQEATTPAKKRGSGRNTGKSTTKTDGAGTKKVGATWRMKEIIAQNLGITQMQLQEQLKVEGYKVADSTAAGILSDFKQSIKVIRNLGLWKED